MKDETTYLQTHTMAYEIFNHAHGFCKEKQLTTKILRIRTSLPFVNNISSYFKGILWTLVHLQSLSFECAVIVHSVITRVCLKFINAPYQDSRSFDFWF